MSGLDLQNEANTNALLTAALRADQDALREAQVGHEALDRRSEDAELSLGDVDDHLAALSRLSRDVLGHEYESLTQIADAVETVRDDLEGLL